MQRARQGRPVVGIGGGYQMLGEKLCAAEGSQVEPGLALLPVTTTFSAQQTAGRASAEVLLPFAQGLRVEGYVIQQGETKGQGHCQAALRLDDGSEDGAVSASGQVWGTSLHGIFDLPGLRRAWLNTLRERRGWQPLGARAVEDRAQRFDALADAVEKAIDLPALYRLLGLTKEREEHQP